MVVSYDLVNSRCTGALAMLLASLFGHGITISRQFNGICLDGGKSQLQPILVRSDSFAKLKGPVIMTLGLG